jgi:hypothetical protein
MNMANRPTHSGQPTPAPEPRANSHERPREKAKFLDGSPAAKSDPEGTPYTPFGPGTAAWSKTEKRK